MDIPVTEHAMAAVVFLGLLIISLYGLVTSSRRATANDASRHARPGPWTVSPEQQCSLAPARPAEGLMQDS